MLTAALLSIAGIAAVASGGPDEASVATAPQPAVEAQAEEAAAVLNEIIDPSTSTSAPEQTSTSTTAAPSTSAPATTVAPTTSAPPATVAATPAPAATAAPTTAAPATTAAPTTTAPPSTVPEGEYEYGDPRGLQVWLDLADCESHGNWSADTGNGYYGGLQFSLSAWQDVGGSGYPHEHPRDTQIEKGRRLQAKYGWGAWPHCSEKLGLR